MVFKDVIRKFEFGENKDKFAIVYKLIIIRK